MFGEDKGKRHEKKMRRWRDTRGRQLLETVYIECDGRRRCQHRTSDHQISDVLCTTTIVVDSLFSYHPTVRISLALARSCVYVCVFPMPFTFKCHI